MINKQKVILIGLVIVAYLISYFAITSLYQFPRNEETAASVLLIVRSLFTIFAIGNVSIICLYNFKDK